MTTRSWRAGSAARHRHVQGAAPRVLFLGLNYAGHQTRFANLQAHTRDDPRIRPSYRCVTGWKPGGLIERLPGPGWRQGARARPARSGSPGNAAPPGCDLEHDGRDRDPVPVVAAWQPETATRSGSRLHLRSVRGSRARVLRTCIAARAAPHARTPARACLVAKRLRVHALVALGRRWAPSSRDSPKTASGCSHRASISMPGACGPERGVAPQQRLKLLFVGGDFDRKGGQILLDVFRDRFSDRCDLDVVTRDAVPTVAGARVHRAEANSPLLRSLYATADLFVLPTRAECFGIAAVEALASGLPVILGNSGGTPDIIDDGETGWLVEPTQTTWLRFSNTPLPNETRFLRWGRRARLLERFDGKRNADACRRSARGRGRPPAPRSTPPCRIRPSERRVAVTGSEPALWRRGYRARDSHASPACLLVLQSVAVGGMESHCVDLSAELSRRGVGVMVIVPRDSIFDLLADRFSQRARVSCGSIPMRAEIVSRRHERACSSLASAEAGNPTWCICKRVARLAALPCSQPRGSLVFQPSS